MPITMITDLSRDLKVDGKPMKDIVFTLNEQINFLQSQIYDLQNQVFEYEARFKGMSLAASCRTRETHSSSYDGGPLPWKSEDKISSSSPLYLLLHHQKRTEYRVWALPLAFAKLGGGAPVSYHPTIFLLLLIFSSVFFFR